MTDILVPVCLAPDRAPKDRSGAGTGWSWLLSTGIPRRRPTICDSGVPFELMSQPGHQFLRPAARSNLAAGGVWTGRCPAERIPLRSFDSPDVPERGATGTPRPAHSLQDAVKATSSCSNRATAMATPVIAPPTNTGRVNNNTEISSSPIIRRKSACRPLFRPYRSFLFLDIHFPLDVQRVHGSTGVCGFTRFPHERTHALRVQIVVDPVHSFSLASLLPAVGRTCLTGMLPYCGHRMKSSSGLFRRSQRTTRDVPVAKSLKCSLARPASRAASCSILIWNAFGNPKGFLIRIL